ncbi:hypothetical protein OG555_39510 [Kribbella sp. NBC_01484]|nr:hypothetical protein [Kribbella sp. NBC_01484]
MPVRRPPSAGRLRVVNAAGSAIIPGLTVAARRIRTARTQQP